jgi:hypothetical protein
MAGQFKSESLRKAFVQDYAHILSGGRRELVACVFQELDYLGTADGREILEKDVDCVTGFQAIG